MISTTLSADDHSESLLPSTSDPTNPDDDAYSNFEDVLEYLRAGRYLSAGKSSKRVIRRKAASFILQEGTLYYHGGNMQNLRRVVLERAEQLRLVEVCHAGIGDTKQARAMGGHFGRTKTLQKLTTRYYWKGMKADVENLVGCYYYYPIYICKRPACQLMYIFVQIQHCDSCQRINKKLDKTSASLHPIPVKAEVWSQVGVDLIGPLPTSRRGNKYIITLSDYFSKWPEAEPVADKTGHTVALFLYKVWDRTICLCSIN